MNETAALDWNAIVVAHIKTTTLSLYLYLFYVLEPKSGEHIHQQPLGKKNAERKTRKSHKGDKINWREKKKVMTIYYKKRQPN